MKLVRKIIDKGLSLYQSRLPSFFNDSDLLKELESKIFVNKAQILYWVERYKENPNPVAHPYIEIAQMFTNAGLHEDASRFYLYFLKTKPDKSVFGLYLQNLLLSQTATNKSLLKAHKLWARKYDSRWRRFGWKKRVNKTAKEKIRIGYLCHFFGNSISQNVMLPFLELHDRNKFEVYCYDDGETPAEFHSLASQWRDIRGLSDQAVAKMIQDDGVDILQEANGFCIINRFGALSYRPAPIQINWYNHTATTGLPFVDYVVSDSILIPDDDLPYFVEHAYRTKKFIAAIHFEIEKFGNLVLDPPCSQKGMTTFAYFGGSHKITLSAIKLWSDVLKRVPGSRFILKGGAYTHDIYRQIFLKHFKQFGIDAERIEFEGWTDQAATLKKYNEIDIMLDNAPVTGGSTMFEALMQGVPVVTLSGHRWAARSGASVLKTLNHPELVAATPDDYVNIAVKLSQDVGALSHYRQHLRKEMLASSLSSMESCYKNFEKAYLTMWDTWVHSCA
jgi:predicted O-linked N-acetylglucosamine transferase (SPINDLY family)